MGVRASLSGIMLAVTVCAACPAAAGTLEEDMEAENARWLAVFAKAEPLAFASLYTKDAVIIAQGWPPLTGRTAMVQFWNKLLEMGWRSEKLDIESTWREGKIAYQAARWTVVIGGGANAKARTGNMVRLFEQQADGSWLTKMQMYNLD